MPSRHTHKRAIGEDLLEREAREMAAILKPVIEEKSREMVRAEVADLLDDAEQALARVAPPTPDADNPLYYPLLFLVRSLRPHHPEDR